MTPVQNQSPAYVLQKGCVISKTQKIAVGCFGPCYVLTGYDPKTKYSFVAHIDDMTQVESISQIFATLKQLGVDSNDLNLSLMGGHKERTESNKWGHKITWQLKQEGVYDKVDMTLFQKKEAKPSNWTTNDEKETYKFFFMGGLMDPAKGLFQFFQKYWKKLEDAQTAANDKEMADLLKEACPGISHLLPHVRLTLCKQLLMTKGEIPLKINVV
jgi:hypothetical protein